MSRLSVRHAGRSVIIATTLLFTSAMTLRAEPLWPPLPPSAEVVTDPAIVKMQDLLTRRQQVLPYDAARMARPGMDPNDYDLLLSGRQDPQGSTGCKLVCSGTICYWDCRGIIGPD